MKIISIAILSVFLFFQTHSKTNRRLGARFANVKKMRTLDIKYSTKTRLKSQQNCSFCWINGREGSYFRYIHNTGAQSSISFALLGIWKQRKADKIAIAISLIENHVCSYFISFSLPLHAKRAPNLLSVSLWIAFEIKEKLIKCL